MLTHYFLKLANLERKQDGSEKRLLLCNWEESCTFQCTTKHTEEESRVEPTQCLTSPFQLQQGYLVWMLWRSTLFYACIYNCGLEDVSSNRENENYPGQATKAMHPSSLLSTPPWAPYSTFTGHHRHSGVLSVLTIHLSGTFSGCTCFSTWYWTALSSLSHWEGTAPSLRAFFWPLEACWEHPTNTWA